MGKYGNKSDTWEKILIKRIIWVESEVVEFMWGKKMERIGVLESFKLWEISHYYSIYCKGSGEARPLQENNVIGIVMLVKILKLILNTADVM